MCANKNFTIYTFATLVVASSCFSDNCIACSDCFIDITNYCAIWLLLVCHHCCHCLSSQNHYYYCSILSLLPVLLALIQFEKVTNPNYNDVLGLGVIRMRVVLLPFIWETRRSRHPKRFSRATQTTFIRFAQKTKQIILISPVGSRRRLEMQVLYTFPFRFLEKQ